MERLGSFFARIAQRILPDPMVIACLLTLLVVAAALLSPQTSELAEMSLLARAPAVAGIWLGGVWNKGFLVFALQMCVVLLTGFGLAKAPPAMRALRFLASRVGSNRSAVLLVTFVSCVGCWINWGLGLIAAGILATRLRSAMSARGLRCQYALIVAGAYAGMMIWHGGLSGSAPLKMAKDGVDITRAIDGQSVQQHLAAIDIGHTTLSGGNLLLSAVVIVGIPLLMRSMARRDPADIDDLPPAPADLAAAPAQITSAPADEKPAPAERLNRTRLIPLLIAAIAVVAVARQLRKQGTAAINLNFVNTVFLTLGLLLHRSLVEYVRAVADGGRAVTGIILQFPIYSGIQGVMAGAGIAAALSQGFVEAAQWSASVLHVSAEHTFPVATFLSAGLVNLFVPSGGGQWIVQGPIMCSAADSLSTSIEATVLAVSYGDQWTNMIQPFWAIPLMGLTGVNVRHFMGYCALLFLLAGPVFAIALLLF